MTKSQRTCLRPGRMLSRFARSSDVMTCLFSSHWLMPNWSRMWSPLRTTNFSSNFSFSSRCHWNVEVRGADDKDPFGQPAELQFADEQSRHDGLAGAGVVSQQEPDPGELQQVVVNGFKLVRQGVNAGDGQAEVGVELVGDAERVRLKAQAEKRPISRISIGGADNLKAGQSLVPRR